MFSSAAAFLYCFKLIYGVYLGHSNSKETKEVKKDAPIAFLIPQYVIAIFLMVVGTAPGIFTPMFNNILNSLGLAPIKDAGIYTITAPFGEYNGAVIMGAFMGIFALILVLVLLLKSKAKQAEGEFDFSYCGEVPFEKTPLHSGYGLTNELKRIGFINQILKRTTANFYNGLAQELHNLGEFLRGMYSGNLSNIFAVTVVFFIVLLWLGM
jgi:NADH-quinone oxidoreductase subunit M